MWVSMLFIISLILCFICGYLCEEIKYQKNINKDYVNDILSKSNIIIKKEQTIHFYKMENEVLRKTVDLNEEINNHLNKLNNE